MTATAPRFCTQCGKPLAEADRFCGHCGAPAAATTPAPAPVPTGSAPAAVGAPTPAPGTAQAAPDEPVLGVVPNLARKKGLLSYENFNLIVTPRRLIFALATQKMLADAAKQAADEAKAEGKGLLGRMVSTMASGFVFHRRYLEMEPEAILRETQGNFALDPRIIKSIRLVMGDSDENEPDKVIIQTVSGKMQFQSKGLNQRAAKSLLGQVVQNTR